MAKFNLVLALAVFALAFTLTAPNAVAAEAEINVAEDALGVPQECVVMNEFCFSTNKPTTVLHFAKLIASAWGVSHQDVIRYSGWSELDGTVVADRWYQFSLGQTSALVAQN